jgi:hypothetical protein
MSIHNTPHKIISIAAEYPNTLWITVEIDPPIDHIQLDFVIDANGNVVFDTVKPQSNEMFLDTVTKHESLISIGNAVGFSIQDPK